MSETSLNIKVDMVFAGIPELLQVTGTLLSKFNEEFDEPYQFDHCDFLQTWIKWMDDPSYKLAVAKEGSKVIGAMGFSIHVHPFNKSIIMSKELFWYILPEYRANGIGQKLLEEVEMYCHKAGVSKMTMIAMKNDSFMKVHGFYLNSGYRQIESMYIKDLDKRIEEPKKENSNGV